MGPALTISQTLRLLPATVNGGDAAPAAAVAASAVVDGGGDTTVVDCAEADDDDELGPVFVELCLRCSAFPGLVPLFLSDESVFLGRGRRETRSVIAWRVAILSIEERRSEYRIRYRPLYKRETK